MTWRGARQPLQFLFQNLAGAIFGQIIKNDDFFRNQRRRQVLPAEVIDAVADTGRSGVPLTLRSGALIGWL